MAAINFPNSPSINQIHTESGISWIWTGTVWNIVDSTTFPNPVSGGGSAGQVAYWSASNAITGESNLYWDATNDRLGIGTSTPSVALDVTGLSSFKGTTASDGGQLGAELLSSTGWTSTGWSGSFATGWTHVIGNTTALTNTLAAVINTYYQITYTVTGRTAGTFVIDFGGITTAAISSTGYAAPVATSTGTLSITPTTDFDGTIVISIKAVTPGNATITIKNSLGTVISEINGSSSNTNTFFGLDAGSRNTTGVNNTFYGTNAGQNNTGAINNVFVGLNSGRLTTNSNNTFVGSSSGSSNTTGALNSFFGTSSGLSNSTGTSNSFFGYNSGYNVTTGTQNSFFGVGAGELTSTASNNTFFGRAAGVNLNGSNNTAIGQGAARYAGSGTTANQTSSNSLYLGYQTRASASGNTNEVVIGYDVVGLGSNTTVLGNASTVTTGIYGNLLLGSTTSTGEKLQVTGNSLFTGSTTASGAIATGVNMTPTLVAAANNDVLVGLDINPTFTLGAFTGVKRYATRIVQNANQTLSIQSNSGTGLSSTHLIEFTDSSLNRQAYLYKEGTSGDFGIGTDISSVGGKFFLALRGTRYFQLYNTGDLLIGNASNSTPDSGYKLDVSGTTRSQNTLTVSAGGADVTGLSSFTGTTASDGGQLGAELLSSSNWTSTGWTGDFTTGFTHTVGNTTALTNTLAATNNTYYYISWTVTTRTAGSFTVAFGGYTSGALTVTGTIGPLSTSTASLSITPTTDFDGTIVISIKQITGSSANIKVKNSAGTNIADIRVTNGDNFFFGANSGARTIYTLLNGYSNTGFGHSSLEGLTTGIGNTAFGRLAAYRNTIGNYNTAIGNGSLQNNTTGSQNTTIGYTSGNSISTGSANVAIGDSSLTAITTTSNNIAVGQRALQFSTGSSNTAVGTQAFGNNTSGSNNVGIGLVAGLNNASDSNLVSIGANSTRYYSGGTSNATSFSNGVYIGYLTKVAAAAATNEIVIGYTAEGLGSNRTVIGNSSTTSTWLGGNLLLGSTTDGGDRLQVTGTSSFTGTTATDGGQLGAELLSTSGWTSTDWTGSFGAGWTHTTGNTTALTNTLAAVNGNYYQITYTVTGRTAGTFSIAFGGVTTSGLSATGAVGPRATSTGTLSITPTTDFDGTIVISIKVITAGSASITIKNSSGTVISEIGGSSSNTNTFLGLDAGARITTGTGNALIGTYSGQNITSGSSNTFFGSSAGLNNTTGNNNTFIGNNAGQLNIIGSNNSFFGFFAGQNNNLGGSNSFFGRSSGISNTDGTDNAFFGIFAGGSNTTSSGSSYFGAYSGLNLTGASNTAVGNNAGRYAGSGTTQNQTSSNSIYIGYQPRASASGNTNEIVIGYDVVGLGSNTTILGNSSTVTTGIYGNLLLGTTTDAGYKLDVNGGARIVDNIYFGASGSLRGFIGRPSWDNSYVSFQNATLSISSANAAISQSSNGLTVVNAASGQTLYFRTGNSNNGFNLTNYLVTFNDAVNIATDTTTGTKIGTSTSQKIGFWNVSPISQPTTAIAEATFVENSGGTAVNVDSTFAGYTLQQIAQALKDIGILQ